MNSELRSPVSNPLERRELLARKMRRRTDKQNVSFNLLDFYRRGLRLFGLMTSFLDAEGCAAVLRNLGPGFDEGVLRAPAIAERYPLEQAGMAYARVASSEVAGRVLLVMG